MCLCMYVSATSVASIMSFALAVLATLEAVDLVVLLRCRVPLYWVAVRELDVSHHNVDM